jgi:hypothetical protein
MTVRIVVILLVAITVAALIALAAGGAMSETPVP